MTAEDVASIFVLEMRVFFGDPPGDEPDRAVNVYLRALSRFTPDVLRRTALHFQTTVKRRTWPMPADVIEQAKRIEHELYVAAQRAKASSEPVMTDSQKWARADTAILSTLGLRAADEGWANGLHNHWLEKMREPTAAEIVALRDGSTQMRAKHHELCVGERTPLNDALISVGDAMIEREHDLAERVRAWARRERIGEEA